MTFSPIRRASLPATQMVSSLGAAVLGAFAVGAVAIGSMAIGGLGVRKAKVRSVEIDDLTVRRLHVMARTLDSAAGASREGGGIECGPRVRMFLSVIHIHLAHYPFYL